MLGIQAVSIQSGNFYIAILDKCSVHALSSSDNYNGFLTSLSGLCDSVCFTPKFLAVLGHSVSLVVPCLLEL